VKSAPDLQDILPPGDVSGATSFSTGMLMSTQLALIHEAGGRDDWPFFKSRGPAGRRVEDYEFWEILDTRSSRHFRCGPENPRPCSQFHIVLSVTPIISPN
jgi:hypothetical protein